jgi:hypothetical protein
MRVGVAGCSGPRSRCRSRALHVVWWARPACSRTRFSGSRRTNAFTAPSTPPKHKPDATSPPISRGSTTTAADTPRSTTDAPTRSTTITSSQPWQRKKNHQSAVRKHRSSPHRCDRVPPPIHSPLHTPPQRQSRTLQPHPRRRGPLRPHLDLRSPTRRSDQGLEHPLQLPSKPHCHRRPTTSLTPPNRRHQRHEPEHLGASAVGYRHGTRHLRFATRTKITVAP